MVRSNTYPMSKPVEVRPALGGALLTDSSPDSIGLANYSIKQDWRRVGDREIRSEGYDKFFPVQDRDVSEQYQPAGATDPLTVVASFERPNGQHGIIAGSQTTLWKFEAATDAAYGVEEYCYQTVESDPDAPYWEITPGVWTEIGSGFSASGLRWQRLTINGYLVLNNAVDLPMTYRLEDDTVKPIYELRELSVASVGRICEHNGMLICMNIKQIREEKWLEIFEPIDAAGWVEVMQIGAESGGTKTMSLSGPTLTCSESYFTVQMVGSNILLLNGLTVKITGFIDTTHVTVDVSGTYSNLPFWNLDVTAVGGVPNIPYAFSMDYIEPLESQWQIGPGSYLLLDDGDTREITYGTNWSNAFFSFSSQSFRVVNPNAYAEVTEQIDQYSWRTIWSVIGEPRRFGAVYNGSIDAGSVRLELNYRSKSIVPGMELIIPGAGYGGGNLAATVMWLEADHYAWLSEPAQTTVENVSIQAADVNYALLGYYDLLDDSKSIIAGESLRNTLVIYKAASVYIGRYTGLTSGPFLFDRVYQGPEMPLYPNLLVPLKGQAHLYRGREHFYTFDLVNRVPQVFLPLEDQKRWFLRTLQDNATDYPWAVECKLLNEIWIVGAEETIRYNYNTGKVSTTTVLPHAAVSMFNPGVATQEWFVMAVGNGTLFRYGYVNEPDEAHSVALTKASDSAVVTAGSAVFEDRHYGWSIVLADGRRFAISAVTSSTEVTVVGSGAIDVSSFELAPAIWHRDGADYDSVLAGGYGYGKGGELKWDRYELLAGDDSPEANVLVEFMGGRTAGSMVAAFSTTFQGLQSETNVSLLMAAHYISDKLTVSGKNNPIELVSRVFGVRNLNTKSLARRVTE